MLSKRTLPNGAEPPRPIAQPSRAGCLRTAAAPMAVAYTLGIGALLALRGLTFESSAFELVSILVPFLLLATIPFLLFGALLRSRALLVSGGILALIFTVMFGGRFLPSVPGAGAAGPTLRVLTYNLGAERLDPDVAFQVFDQAQADVIGLQELTPTTARALSARGDYPYQLVDPYGPTTGLLSRYPILASQLYHSPHGRSFWGVVLDWHGQAVTVFVLHPPSPGVRVRRGLPTGVDMRRTDRYLQDALNVIGAPTGPVIVLGDFNSSDQSRTYLRVRQTFSDAFASAGRGFGFTWPNPRRFMPVVRIDYVFFSDALRARDAYVGCESSSDHCYLVAERVSSPISSPFTRTGNVPGPGSSTGTVTEKGWSTAVQIMLGSATEYTSTWIRPIASGSLTTTRSAWHGVGREPARRI